MLRKRVLEKKLRKILTMMTGGEGDRELFIKGDRFEDVSEDTAEEEVMKQAKVPKSREGIKKELNSGSDISDDPGTMLGRVWEAKSDVDKEEGFKDTDEMDKDMVKQDKALFNREKVPEARTESTGKADSQYPKNWRLKELMLMLLFLQVGNHNEVAEVMKKNNSREIIAAAVSNTEYEAGIKVHQGRERIRYEKPEMRAVMINTTDAVRPDMKYEAGIKVHQGRELIMHEEPEMRAVMVNITDADRFDMKYKTGTKAHQGREFIMHEEPETRNGMFKITHKVKYDKNIAVKTLLHEKPEPRDGMLKNNSKPVIESLGEAACENMLDNGFGKHRAHERPGMRTTQTGSSSCMRSLSRGMGCSRPTPSL